MLNDLHWWVKFSKTPSLSHQPTACSMATWREATIIMAVQVISLDSKFFLDWDTTDREKPDDCNDNKLENWPWTPANVRWNKLRHFLKFSYNEFPSKNWLTSSPAIRLGRVITYHLQLPLLYQNRFWEIHCQCRSLNYQHRFCAPPFWLHTPRVLSYLARSPRNSGQTGF